MSGKNVVALFHALSGAACMVVSLFAAGQMAIPEQPIKAIGLTVFALGGLFFAYAVAYLRAAFQGNVDPVTDRLVTDGPYRLVRHPLYLAMVVMCGGLSLGLRSVVGLLLSAFVFFPLSVVRARLEEEALGSRFGEDWDEYASRTGFMVPFLY